MLKLEPLCFCTNNVPGNDLEPALDMAVRCGFSFVELSAIDGISEQISAEAVCPSYGAHIRRLLDAHGLRCFAVSGHCDMTDEHSFARLLKKIEFAGMVGAKYLNTRCGPPERMEAFCGNVRQAAALAAQYQITLNLESYGDIVGPASRCGDVFKMLQIPNLGYNYDPGNTFRFEHGRICIEEDLAAAAVPLEYIHLKDASLHDGYIWNDPLGKGQLNYPAIIAQLDLQRSTPLPAGLEIPMTFRVRNDDLGFDFLAPALKEIEQAVRTSLQYLSRFAEFSLAAPQ